ncbi:MAG: cyclopropane-fatty-acyl-phospholipid synthase family protein [Hydrogenophaga sp.]
MTTTMSLTPPRPMGRAAAAVTGLLNSLRGGQLEMRWPDGSSRWYGEGAVKVHLHVRDVAMFDQVLAKGDIGFAESYLDGQWDSPDLTALLKLLADNRDALKRAVYGSWRSLLSARVRHWFNGNSKAGSKRNIMAHYDLGNDFYKLWLDPSMTYSSALYQDEDGNVHGDLELAQKAKYARMLDRLDAKAGERILEIGCGWGGLAEAATQRGLQVTGVTLSHEQLKWAQARVPSADLRLQDYRDVSERYDHVVSIEMFEAVGERWWPTYFKKVADSLKPGGTVMLQTITIRDDLFDAYRKGTDFIQQYVFPGGMLPSSSALHAAAANQGLVVKDEFAFGQDYARTLSEWRVAFEREWPVIAAQGFDENFRRLWRFYLAYCEAGFLAGNVNVVQLELTHAPS